MNPVIGNVIANAIDEHSFELRELSLKIHDEPELSFHEHKAYHWLTAYLEKKGFKVTRQVANLKTSFVAEFSNNANGRRVGFCSEYDALPGVGHGCGHNLIAISGVACALAMKALLEQNLVQGTVVLFGTPAEEKGTGKVDMVKAGEFQNRVDFCMMLHPFARDGVYAKMLAIDTLDVEYFGKASHAGMAPWNGINALDALMQAFDNVAMLRQQTLPSNRIHGIITNGGKSPNVIPDYTSANFYARSVTRDQLKELSAKLNKCFEAAAVSTGCQVKLNWVGAVDDVFQNDSLASYYTKYMTEEGATMPSREETEKDVSGSTDMGTVSYTVPSLHPGFAIGTTATNHTVEFTEAARTEAAHEYTLRAARSLSKTAASVLLDSKLFEQVVADFHKRVD
ncbi:hypothetical protein DFQ28_006384 [Apophysomyces sp. BC1034]|nr:hypothetical protein DFQ30_006246 [Apophysomyces sp. BC1015]KAG0177122.1 hypothetical protein DFQ29_005209 [Apophysomyces sp. BC1021]KAG0187420.1 hypothetical protein DFQ28_006384 [Apophysomyces sp. BC1034]